VTAPTLRKSLVLEILGEEVAIEVDFRLVELFERVWNAPADKLVPLFMAMDGVQRNKVADAMADLIGRKAGVEMTRTQIREAVITAPAVEFYGWVGLFSNALLFTLRHMTGEEYDQVLRELKEQRTKKKTPEPPADSASGSASPEPATT
jgi:hypothetical protein